MRGSYLEGDIRSWSNLEVAGRETKTAFGKPGSKLEEWRGRVIKEEKQVDKSCGEILT